MMNDDILSITTLHDLLDYDARRFLSGETQLKSILPEWVHLAGSAELKTILHEYHAHVQQNEENLHAFIIRENINSLVRINNVMQEMIRDIREKLGNCANPNIRDAGLLSGLQAINHFKLSQYGTAAAFARAIGDDLYSDVFKESELKEKKIDARLTQIAEQEINKSATAPLSISHHP